MCTFGIRFVLVPGVVLSPIHSIDGDTASALLVLDGKSFDVVARAEVTKEVLIPFSFHGIFIPATQ